jgi:hypothetical protein
MKKEILGFLNNLIDELQVLRKHMDEVASKYEEKIGKDEMVSLIENIIERSGLIQFKGLQIRMKVEKIIEKVEEKVIY